MAPRHSFQEALDSCTATGSKVHLLLGNGFSRAYRDDIFSYDSLFEAADLSFSEFLRPAFDSLGTTDFESVIRALQTASQLVSVYAASNPNLASQLAQDADKLKNALAETVARNHPSLPSEVSDSQYESCRQFLKPFDRIYTFNYDLLLYWVSIKQLYNPTVLDEDKIECDDGFRSEDSADEFVIWDGDHKQNVFYLHGALHLFQSQHDLQKYTWSRTDVPIIQQVRTALQKDLFPLFVSEGTSKQKRGAILRNGYLTKCIRSFKNLSGSIISFGASLSDRDAHVLDAVVKHSKIRTLWVGLWGDADSASNRATKSVAELYAQKSTLLRPRAPLSVQYYDASTAQPWGDP